MIKFFRDIRKKLQQEVKTNNYLKYAIGVIVLVVIDKSILCPVRDFILAERLNTKSKSRAFRYETYNVPNGTLNRC